MIRVPGFIRLGLMGWPVGHSVSPAMHNAALDALGLQGHYVLLPVEPGRLAPAIGTLADQGFAGMNVTVPHKQAVIPYLDQISAEAKAIGAVNTVVRCGNHWHGHNTDGDGFLAALIEGGFEPAGRQALLLGAGGAARAAAWALARSGCAVTLYNRTPARAARLAQDLSELAGMAPIRALLEGADLVGANLDRFDLLVNATSLGMWPAVNASPWPEGVTLPAHWTVFDLIYHPVQTKLLVTARDAGARIIGGLGMLVHQGALAFERWTGAPPPIAVMHAAAIEALAEHDEH